MTDATSLADRFEENRSRLQDVAYRMLGSRAEAADAVQEAWLRLARSDVEAIDNLAGWLTTVVGRISLDSAGHTQLAQICIGTNVGDYAFYIGRPRATNDFHGLGSFLIMSEQLRRTTP